MHVIIYKRRNQGSYQGTPGTFGSRFKMGGGGVSCRKVLDGGLICSRVYGRLSRYPDLTF